MLNVLFYVYEGQNCLHLASFHGFLSLVENMVDLGADIDAKVSKVPGLKLSLDQRRRRLGSVYVASLF